MVVKSPYPEVTIPEVSLPELILSSAERRGDKPALIDGPSGRTLTYGELARQARALAAGLQARGFVKGDVFAIYMPNLPEYAVVFQGVALAGGVNTTINPLYTVEELAFQLEDCKARYLVTVPPFASKAVVAARKAGVQEVFVVGEAVETTPLTA